MNLDGLWLIVPVLVLVLAIGLVLTGIRVIPAEQRLVVFRLGAFAGVRGPGLTILVPLLERGVAVEMRERTRTLENLDLLLADRSHVRVEVEYTFRVEDAAASVMQVAQPERALEQLLTTTLRTLAANQTRGDFWIGREAMENELVARTREAVGNWGMGLQRVSIRETKGKLNE